jgi:hypothetical protein
MGAADPRRIRINAKNRYAVDRERHLALSLIEQELRQDTEDEVRTRLGDDAFIVALDGGHKPAPEEALAVALRAGH